jgi:membrane protein implicated in regulation of membrane protease activity
MTTCRRLALGILEFVVGDDWLIGVGVAISLALTAVVADLGLSAWWVMPPAILLLLTLTVRRAVREAVHSASRTSAAEEL